MNSEERRGEFQLLISSWPLHTWNMSGQINFVFASIDKFCKNFHSSFCMNLGDPILTIDCFMYKRKNILQFKCIILENIQFKLVIVIFNFFVFCLFHFITYIITLFFLFLTFCLHMWSNIFFIWTKKKVWLEAKLLYLLTARMNMGKCLNF